jgi:(1->4)-alpha-D-glucan 1-alpha-D-glucosylmutase
LRRAQPRLFSHGEYRRLNVHGSRAHHVCAFARRCEGHSVIVIAPRLYRRLLDDPDRLPLGAEVWENTLVELPREERSRALLCNVLDGAQLSPIEQGAARGILVAQALAEFPVALLASAHGAASTPAPGTR